jgi:hypothetical protein
MNKHTPSAQHSAGKGLKGLLLSPHISGAMKAGVPMVVLIRESGFGCKARQTTSTSSTSIKVWNRTEQAKQL